jgi:hypothetical protein
MKRILLSAVCLVLLFCWSCQSDDLNDVTPIDENGLALDHALAAGGKGKGNSYGLLRTCASHEVLQRKLRQNPALVRKMQEIEAHTLAFKNSKLKNTKPKKEKKPKKGKGVIDDGNDNSSGNDSGGTTDSGGSTDTGSDTGTDTGNDSSTGDGEVIITDPLPTKYTIPVYVHVVYSKTEENISVEQIRSQIAALNADFSGTNADLSNTPAEFKGKIAEANINFTLNESLHIRRVSTSRTEWGTTDEMKYSAKGGSDAYMPGSYLNIWICNIGGGVLGYAQFPGGAPSTDGVVVGPQYFGTTGYVAAPYNKGRTATHEVGHWLNLIHIWGDGDCTKDDLVEDTPSADRPSYGCMGTPTYCSSPAMTMNFMDYSDDACMYMFTLGQKLRMHALFSRGGARSTFAK